MMSLILIALFVIGPIAEIFVLLQAGSMFGALPVVAMCLATAVIGGVILRIQGLAAMTAAAQALRDGRPPIEPVVDGVFLVIAAPLLMTPGFITDALGFALLIPPLRHAIARRALAAVMRRVERGEATITVRRG